MNARSNSSIAPKRPRRTRSRVRDDVERQPDPARAAHADRHPGPANDAAAACDPHQERLVLAGRAAVDARLGRRPAGAGVGRGTAGGPRDAARVAAGNLRSGSWIRVDGSDPNQSPRLPAGQDAHRVVDRALRPQPADGRDAGLELVGEGGGGAVAALVREPGVANRHGLRERVAETRRAARHERRVRAEAAVRKDPEGDELKVIAHGAAAVEAGAARRKGGARRRREGRERRCRGCGRQPDAARSGHARITAGARPRRAGSLRGAGRAPRSPPRAGTS